MPRQTLRATSRLSRRTALGGVGAAAAALGLGTVGRAAAQEATPSAMAAHPIVGAWRFGDPATPHDVSYAIFHADGTYATATPAAAAGIGVWRPTGERTAERTVYYLDTDPDPNHVEPGEAIGSTVVTVDATGNAFTETGTLQIKAPDGTVLAAFANNNAGTRLRVQPPVSLATPEGGTPTS